MGSEARFPRLVVAGLGGDSGKTLISLGLLDLAKEKGIRTAAFKKGPDYIDAAWLTWAAGRPARHLDTFLMGFEGASAQFGRFATPDGFNLIEGNRGLYDGADAKGTHSTAELAKLLRAPVLLVVNATKVTRTLAAVVLGCRRFDPDVPFGGVILNQVHGERHRDIITEAVESATGLPVLGAVPRASSGAVLPGRHLGLVTPEEHPGIGDVRETIGRLCRSTLDWSRIFECAASASPLPVQGASFQPAPAGTPVTIGVVRDSAFTFYYPDNLEALEAAGARLVFLSPLSGERFPDDLHALYIGGGFPETHGPAISNAARWLQGLARAASSGLPVYAECGGLMLLSRAINQEGRRYPMAGVLPFEVQVFSTPRGHGYVEMSVDSPNPFFALGTDLRGHEFHYSAVIPSEAPVPTACAVARGTGIGQGRDGAVAGSVWAGYTHLHAQASLQWAEALVESARKRVSGDSTLA